MPVATRRSGISRLEIVRDLVDVTSIGDAARRYAPAPEVAPNIGGKQYMDFIENQMYRFMEHFGKTPQRVFIDRLIFRIIMMELAAQQRAMNPMSESVSLYSMTVTQTAPGTPLGMEHDLSATHCLRYEEGRGYSQIYRVSDSAGRLVSDISFNTWKAPSVQPPIPPITPEPFRRARKRGKDE